MLIQTVRYILWRLKHSGLHRRQSVYELRRKHDSVLAAQRYAKKVSWRDEETPYGRWRIFYPENLKHQETILHFHGGALCMGGIESHSPFVSHLAQKTGCKIALAEYRLAPENPYPASFDDALNFYRHAQAHDEFGGHRIVLSADSGGGLLAFSVVHRCHQLLLETPKMLLLFAPATTVELLDAEDLYADLNLRDSVLDVEQIRRYFKGIFGQHAVDDPLISPLYADYTAFPPFFSVIGAEELLLESLRMVHIKAKKTGVDCQLLVQQHCFHGHYMFPSLFKEADRALQAAADFLEKRL